MSEKSLMAISAFLLFMGLLIAFGAPTGTGVDDVDTADDLFNASKLSDGSITNPGPYFGIIGSVGAAALSMPAENPVMAVIVSVLIIGIARIIIGILPGLGE